MIPLSVAFIGLLAFLYVYHRSVEKERADWAKERRLLLTRIQTPELAPSLAIDEEVQDTNGFVQFDDDDDFHQSVIEREQ